MTSTASRKTSSPASACRCVPPRPTGERRSSPPSPASTRRTTSSTTGTAGSCPTCCAACCELLEARGPRAGGRARAARAGSRALRRRDLRAGMYSVARSREAARHGAAFTAELKLEKRIGARGQVEVTVPASVVDPDGAGHHAGVGDLEVAYKHALLAAPSWRSLLSAGVELALPTGNRRHGV